MTVKLWDVATGVERATLQGHDLGILQSIMPILREFQPVIRTEVYKKLRSADRFALYELLVEAGYDVYRYANGGAAQGAPLVRRQMTEKRHFDVLAFPSRRDSGFRQSQRRAA